MSDPVPDRKGLEDLWRQRLNDANLRIFHDRTVNGVIPDESEWLKGRATNAGGTMCQ